jgi:signal transduction histidine kinase
MKKEDCQSTAPPSDKKPSVKQGAKRNRRFDSFHILLFVLFFCGSFVIGYFLSLLIFRATGTPPAIFAYLIAALLGYAVGFSLVALFGSAARKRKLENFVHTGDLILDALDRISKGDFNVIIEWAGPDPFAELAESVNRMAQELGSIESRRQEFITNVSHEIQSPLTSIGGFAALLKESSLTEAERLHYLNVIETESKRLSRLSENLLKLSSLEMDGMEGGGARRAYSLAGQIRNAALLLEPQWKAKHIELTLELEPVTITADEALLDQVWSNLLHNAVKFTPPHGSVNIRLYTIDNEAVYEISDSGAGIAEADLPHIFERFYKTDKARDRSIGGNGLGLALAKKIVELHNGSIGVASEYGKGSVFTVRLHSDTWKNKSVSNYTFP